MQRVLRPLTSAVVALVVLTAASLASATSQLYVNDEEQAALSTAVVVASVGEAVVGVHPKWQRPITTTTLRIEEVLYGEAPAVLSIEQMGGTVDGTTLYIPGDARLEAGERCVLFLNKVDGNWFLTQMVQSHYRLEQAPKLGTVLRRTLGDGIYRRSPEGKLEAFEEPANKPVVTLDTFRSLMKRLDARRGQ